MLNSSNSSCLFLEQDNRSDQLSILISSIARESVTRPREVKIRTRADLCGCATLIIEVWQGDLARVTGPGGNVAEALREYISAYQEVHGGTFSLRLEAAPMCPALALVDEEKDTVENTTISAKSKEQW